MEADPQHSTWLPRGAAHHIKSVWHYTFHVYHPLYCNRSFGTITQTATESLFIFIGVSRITQTWLNTFPSTVKGWSRSQARTCSTLWQISKFLIPVFILCTRSHDRRPVWVLLSWNICFSPSSQGRILRFAHLKLSKILHLYLKSESNSIQINA